VAAAALLAACGGPGPVQVDDPSRSHLQGAAESQCPALIDALPDVVAGQDRREVTPAGAFAAAWGDPAIVLRCGVDRPAALVRTSFCLEVNSVGWLATQDGREVATAQGDEPVVFSTIGRSVYVELTVPVGERPPGDALADVAAAVSATTDEVDPCG